MTINVQPVGSWLCPRMLCHTFSKQHSFLFYCSNFPLLLLLFLLQSDFCPLSQSHLLLAILNHSVYFLWTFDPVLPPSRSSVRPGSLSSTPSWTCSRPSPRRGPSSSSSTRTGPGRRAQLSVSRVAHVYPGNFEGGTNLNMENAR